MAKNEVQIKKIPSGINIVINNSNKIENKEPKKRRKRRYIKKEEDTSTQDREFGTQTLTGSTSGSSSSSTFKGTPFSVYAASFRRPALPPVLPTLALPAPPPVPALPPPPPVPALPAPPVINNDLLEMMGSFGNRLLDTFAPPKPYRDSGRLKVIDDDEIIQKSSLPEDVKQKYFDEKDKKLEEQQAQANTEAEAFVANEVLAGIPDEQKAELTEKKKYQLLYEQSVLFKPAGFKRNGTNDAKLKKNSIDFKDPVYLFNKDYVESYKAKLPQTINELQAKFDAETDDETRKKIRANIKRAKRILTTISADQLRIEKLFN